LDTSYGAGGRRPFSFSAGDNVSSALFQGDGSVLLAGSTGTVLGTSGPSSHPAVMKLLAHPFTLQVTPAALSVGGLGVPYGYRLSASGGTGAYTFTLANGTLPPGLQLVGDTISGTPTATGAYSFVVQATDGQAAVGATAYTLTINDEASLVATYYESIFGRGADAAGVAFWTGDIDRMVKSGVSVSEAFYVLAGVFFTSPEYLQRNTTDTQFLTDLYHTFFTREPDSAGLAFWASQLAQGRPRGAVMNEFLFSPEFASFMGGVFGPAARSRAEVSMVLDFYRGLLGRLPDDAGLAFWVGQMRAAQCTSPGAVSTTAASISAQFLASPEYALRDTARPAFQRSQGYVLDLYSAFMRRGADLPGLIFYEGQLTGGGMTREQEQQIFVSSAEFQNRVAAVVAQGCSP
jgi:hypothetical protein